MDRDTIIRLAREAGLKVATNISGVTLVGSPLEGVPAIAHITIEEMQRFAALIHDHLTYSSIHSCHPGCTKPACVAMRNAVLAEREECAKLVEAEQARVLGKQEGESWEPVNINIRMTAVLLPDIAAAIRSRT